jgi:HAD superfamily hydrolase (TIGR01509 family)
MPVRALLLDFDGLICDTERAARKSWEELYREVGLTFPAHAWRRMAGRRDGEAVALADLAARLGRPVDAATRDRRRRRKAALAAREPLRPGVAELTSAAVDQGLTLAVVSSSSAAWVYGHLARLGVYDRFEVVVTGDDVTAHKPAPDAYRLALARTQVWPAEAVAFEDSPAGVRAARAAGVRCVAVPSGAGDRRELAGADLVLESLLDYGVDATVQRAAA